MMSHFEVERDLFIPAVERLERPFKSDSTSCVNTTVDEDQSEDFNVAKLSERENEIIRCVAKGMLNKEIADKLFISTHTDMLIL